VLRTVETGTLADAPEIASYLLERLRIGDRIVVRNPSDHVLDYYLWRSGGRRLREINARPATGRVFVVVEPRHLQTLESVQSIEPRLPWAESGGFDSGRHICVGPRLYVPFDGGESSTSSEAAWTEALARIFRRFSRLVHSMLGGGGSCSPVRHAPDE
jgi:hypothetical protein